MDMHTPTVSPETVPAQPVGPAAAGPAAAPGTLYTCPMHPEIR